MKLLICISMSAALIIPGCDRADTTRHDTAPSTTATETKRDESTGDAHRTDSSEPKPVVADLYDPTVADQAPGWKKAGHPYTWLPNDKFWDIRRYKRGDPRMHAAAIELFPDYPRQDRIVQKRAFSLKPEDFDAHCAAEEKAGRVGLLMVEPHNYAFCVKSANGGWVAVPGKPLKTHKELWPMTAKSAGPENEGDLYPIIGGAVEDPALGLYGTGPSETDQ